MPRPPTRRRRLLFPPLLPPANPIPASRTPWAGYGPRWRAGSAHAASNSFSRRPCRRPPQGLMKRGLKMIGGGGAAASNAPNRAFRGARRHCRPTPSLLPSLSHLGVGSVTRGTRRVPEKTAASPPERRSFEVSGGGRNPVPEPTPASPRLIAGLSSSASAGPMSGNCSREALDRVGLAGSFLECLE